jgi:hypothetical protein
MLKFARLHFPVLGILFAVLLFARPLAGIEIMTPDEIKVGMTGVGKSVFKGTVPEEFKFEVLGVLKKAYASHDMILIKCSGANLEYTGIIAGMSGSPVYIAGKLIGAVAMTYGFQKDPIAEVTPARDMIDIMERTDLPDQGYEGGTGDWGWATTSSGDPRPIPCPVTVSGFDRQLCAAFAPKFERFGMQLMPGSGEVSGVQEVGKKAESKSPESKIQNPKSKNADASSPILVPGGAVGVALIRGDMTSSGIGTVTAVDGNRIVAFGHPMFQGGAVNLPMVGGVIHTIMASQELSFKIFSPTEPIGAVTQDRASGIAGTIGQKVPMIPAHVALQSDGRRYDYHYELLNQRNLTPVLLGMAVMNSITSREQAAFDFTARADIALKLRGYPVIHNRRWFTGASALRAAAGEISDPLEYLMTNEFEKVEVESISVALDLTPSTQRLAIVRVTPDRERARPGDVVRLTVALESYRGPARDTVLDVTIPKGTPEGEMSVLVTTPDSAFAAGLDIAGEKIQPRSVRQIIKLLEQVGEENQIIVQGFVKKKGVVISGEKFPNLPPSMFALLSGTREAGTTNETMISLLFEKRYPLEQIVTGGQVVKINIER